MPIASEHASARADAGPSPGTAGAAGPGRDGAARKPGSIDDGSLGAAVAQAREILGFYVQTRLDRVRTTATNVALKAMLYAALGVVALAVLAAAAFFLIAGAVQALASAVNAPGAAALIVGGGLLALFAGGIWFIGWRMRRAMRRRLHAKYRDHHARQRAEFGDDVATMAGRPQESMATREVRS